MRDFFMQVQRAAESDLYFLALAGGLVIPDICAALESPDGLTNRVRYEAWFDRHVAPRYAGAAGTHMTGADCYGLRCSLLHQGRLTPHRGGYSRIIFIEPNNSGTAPVMMHNNILNDALNIDVRRFVSDMVSCALVWLANSEHQPEYQANYSYFMQRYPNGLPPYIGGVPVIA